MAQGRGHRTARMWRRESPMVGERGSRTAGESAPRGSPTAGARGRRMAATTARATERRKDLQETNDQHGRIRQDEILEHSIRIRSFLHSFKSTLMAGANRTFDVLHTAHLYDIRQRQRHEKEQRCPTARGARIRTRSGNHDDDDDGGWICLSSFSRFLSLLFILNIYLLS